MELSLCMVNALCGNLLFKGVPRRSDDFKTNCFFKVEKARKNTAGGLAERTSWPMLNVNGGVRPARHAKARSGGCAPPGMPRPEVGACAPPGARGSGGREPPRVF